MWASLPVLLLVVPPMALFMGCFTLFQFSQMYINIVRLIQRPATGQIWKTIRPYAKQMVKALHATLGEEDKFLSKVQPTHVLLAAILVVLVIFLERVVWQLSHQPARQR